jgi:outer membrane receptor for ferrienterochelin and colicins
MAECQEIIVTNSKNTAVAQAIVSLKRLDSKKVEVLLTDNTGKVLINSGNGDYQVSISHVSYKNFVDTIIIGQSSTIVKLSEKNILLQEVIVTSEYTPLISSESVNKVEVITRQQIENQGASTLQDVMGQVLNVRINHDPVLGSGITMNGLSGQNIKYLVDGVPVIGRLDGNIDISQLTLNNIERVEIVHGPMSVAYGTDAAGGVINLITRHNNNKFQSGVNLFYETIGQYNADFFSSATTGHSSIAVGGGRNFFDGWSATDTSRWQEWKPKEQFFGNVKYRWAGKRLIAAYQLTAFNEKISNKGIPRISPYFAYAFDEYYKTTRITNQVTANYLLNGDKNINSSFSWSLYNRYKNTYRKDLVSLSELLVPGAEEQDSTKMNSYASRSTLSYGSNNSTFKYQVGYDVIVEDASGTRFKNEIKRSGDYAVFLSAEYMITSKLEIKPALRIAYNTTFKAPAIPSLSLKYDFTKKLQARLSYGKGFRAPGLKERYLYFVDINHNIRGNEELLPEYSDNFLAAVNYNYKVGKVTTATEISGFSNDIRNMITLAQPDPQNSLYTYINIGTFSTHGVAANQNFIWKNLSARAGISYTGRYNIYSDSGAFKKYIYSPDLNAMVQYSFTKINLTPSVYFKYNGKLPGYKLNADNTITQFSNESYRFLDASIRKGFFRNSLQLIAGVKNILNVQSINALVEGSAHNSGTGQQAIGTGRSMFIKLQYQLQR